MLTKTPSFRPVVICIRFAECKPLQLYTRGKNGVNILFYTLKFLTLQSWKLFFNCANFLQNIFIFFVKYPSTINQRRGRGVFWGLFSGVFRAFYFRGDKLHLFKTKRQKNGLFSGVFGGCFGCPSVPIQRKYRRERLRGRVES